jgi:glutamate synthase domain-containing protein 1
VWQQRERIAGLFLKSTALEPQLGKLIARTLSQLRGRGPDGAGFAVYGQAP